ncbi:hypothetical protein D9M72_559170 [compost metagenome]
MAVSTSPGSIGRMETTMGPWMRPAGVHSMFVRYMGTLRPVSVCRSGMPSLASAASKVKLQPMRTPTMSSRQTDVTSETSSASSPSTHTR